MTASDWRTWLVDCLQVTRLEKKDLRDGTLLLGRVPSRGPDAWHHILFRGLTSPEILRVEQMVGLHLPQQLKEFFSAFNGVSLFSDSLSIYGLRSAHDRTSLHPEPYGIDTTNSFERLRGAPESAIFLGFYASDGSHLYLDSDTGVVYHCGRFDPLPLSRWPDLRTMMLSEVRRLLGHYTADGQRTEGLRGSAPSPAHT
jgi:hypothetical protein